MRAATRVRQAVILAAGRGNRMRPLTDTMPKAMAPFRGSTLIAQSLENLHHQVEHIHVTVGYKSAMLAEYLMSAGVSSVLNTAGHSNSWWIHNTLLRHVDEPVLVLTCDNVTELDLPLLADELERVGEPCGMLVPVAPIEGVDGDFIVSEGPRVVRIGREVRSDQYASGIQVLNPARAAALCPDSGDFYAVWSALISQGELGCSALYPKEWFSVDTLEQLARGDRTGA